MNKRLLLLLFSYLVGNCTGYAAQAEDSIFATACSIYHYVAYFKQAPCNKTDPIIEAAQDSLKEVMGGDLPEMIERQALANALCKWATDTQERIDKEMLVTFIMASEPHCLEADNKKELCQSLKEGVAALDNNKAQQIAEKLVQKAEVRVDYLSKCNVSGMKPWMNVRERYKDLCPELKAGVSVAKEKEKASQGAQVVSSQANKPQNTQQETNQIPWKWIGCGIGGCVVVAAIAGYCWYQQSQEEELEQAPTA